MILSSAGIPERVSYGKRVLTYTVIALLLTLGAWMIINTVLVTVAGNIEVDGQKVGKIGGFPWPWNKVKCSAEPITDGENGGNGGDGAVENEICCCDLEGLEFECKTYASQSGCSANCEDYCKGYGAFADCCIDTEERCGSPSPVGQKYCVCETPRHAFTGSGDDINTALVIGTDIKVTELSSGGKCNQDCISENFEGYCYVSPMTLPAEKYRLYCASQSLVESKQVCGMKLADEGGGFGCRIGTTCYNSENECMNAAITTYKSKCYLDGIALCESYSKGFSTYCPNGAQKSLCGGDPNKYVLYRWRKESPSGNFNAYDCSQYTVGDYYCRLNCQHETCP